MERKQLPKQQLKYDYSKPPLRLKVTDREQLVTPQPLPDWTAPVDINEAALTITNLGKDMHEHAFLIGQPLRWVKKKVGHGNFSSWGV